jgi:hypothetical protein
MKQSYSEMALLQILCPENGGEINPKIIEMNYFVQFKSFQASQYFFPAEREIPQIFIPSSVMPAHEKLY